MTATPAVLFENVEKNYRHFKLDLDRLELPKGQVMGMIGPNGAGKSTTIRILMGLVHQDRGSVQVLGCAMPQAQIAAKRDIGFVSEDMRLYARADLRWHMDYIASIYPNWDEPYAKSLMSSFELNASQQLKGFSHGQRVKAHLLLVLARRPKLLVLDEPTTGLDPVARYEVLGELMEVLADEERTILFSSHNTHDVEQLSDHITFIDHGRVIESCDKETFLDNWCRFRLEVPTGKSLPQLPDTVVMKESGHLQVVTTSRFNASMTETFKGAGITVHAVERMTLEEIFVACVLKSRRGENP